MDGLCDWPIDSDYSRPYWEPLVHVEREKESCVSGTGLTGYDYRLVEQAIKA